MRIQVALVIACCLPVGVWTVAAPPAKPAGPGASPAATASAPIKLGVGSSLNGRRCFPEDNPWNQDISKSPVDPNSAALVASIGLDQAPAPGLRA